MRIAILGAGNVGGTLGHRWAETGHAVRYGVPDPAKYPHLDAAPVAEAVRDAEAVVLATPWPAVEDALRAAGDLAGRVVIDATNPIAPDFSGLLPASGGESVAAWTPGARVVKAFNSVGFNLMADPAFPGGPATLLVAGDDPAAKAVALGLASDLGFEGVDAGPLTQARYLEAQAWLWISLAMKYGLGRDIAFRLVRR